ncbi:unnamed protein product [Pedinophyceae sp. YPF-701]|nr:unnamed protein product [Pedinophyceae sp. YPF-701]
MAQSVGCRAAIADVRAGRTVQARPLTSGTALRARRQRSWVGARAQSLESSAEVEVNVPIEEAFKMWEDREDIPSWMPWIHEVKVDESDESLSRWILRTHQFGRDWELSWLAKNLHPVPLQKIHWRSVPGSMSIGIEVPNRGQVRFAKRPNGCLVGLSIQYEVPSPLAPFANALTPLVNSILLADMERFRDKAQRLHAQQESV